MAKHERMTDDELVQLVRNELYQVDFSGTDELAYQREQSTRAYHGELADGLAPTTGMSSLVNNKVQPAVDILTASLTNVFCSDKETVVFSANTDEMIPAAQQTTDIINYVLHRQNEGYKIINRWIKDAAINKNGVVKVTWDDTPVTWQEVYEGSEDEILVLLENQDYEYEIVGKQKITDTITISDDSDEVEITEERMEFTVKFSKPRGFPRIENVPPEEFFINEGTTSINGDVKTRFVCQRQLMPEATVTDMFPDVDPEEIDYAGSSSFLDSIYERENRHTFDGTYDYTGTDSSNKRQRLVEVVEAWVKAPRGPKGEQIWVHTFTCGTTLLMEEEWHGEIPFASFCLFPSPHKFYGQSVYDRIQQYHRAASMLLRSESDVRLQQNTTRIIANPKKIDIRDLQSGRPGIIKASQDFEPGDIQIMPAPSGSGNTLQMLDYIDKQILTHIGVDLYTGVANADAIKSGTDSEKFQQVTDTATARHEAFARELAETGMRDVIWQATKLMLENADEDSVKMLVEKVTPGESFLLASEGVSEYFDKDNVSAKVGLGHQTTQQKLLGAQAIIQQQTAMEASPTAPVPIPYKYKQAAAGELTKALGFDNVNLFFPTAEEIEQAQAAQAQQQAQMMQLQQAQMQQDASFKDREVGAKETAATAKLEAETRKLELAAETEVVKQDNIKADNELNIRRQEAQEAQMAANQELQRANMELQRELAELKARTEIEKQRMADEKTININSGGE